MAEKRKARSLPTSLDVHSSVHKGKPCTACTLCNEKQAQYTHPATWKNKETITQLRSMEPNKWSAVKAVFVATEFKHCFENSRELPT